jgi:hypothetical protein
MDHATYRRWWALHVRVALGETLTAEERAFYDAGATEIDRQEDLGADDGAIGAARARLAVLEADTAHWRGRSQRLNEEIAAVEAALAKRTEQLLSVKE